MCGILGCVGGAQVTDRDFDEALDALRHRGPDDRGVHRDAHARLGHQRLSIIDLTPAGHQPMIDPESGAVIVFNGEIYNYLELRRELETQGHVFHSHTDTEVLLKSYLQWGEACLARLNGMFAFAVWWPDKRRLFIARDRFGVKPFYYSLIDGFGFASEPKALLRLYPQTRVVDEGALYDFLAHGKLYGASASFYRGISVLPPAHCGVFQLDDGEFRLRRYWNYPERSVDVVDPERDASAFAELFDDAVRLRLRSDVPVGISLSGGLDSTAVLASSMRASGPTRVCFTSVYGGHERGEAHWARTAASVYGIEPIEVEAPPGRWIEILRRISWHMDGPGYSPAVYPLWFLMRSARRRHVPVLLEGQGADEELGGYTQYAAMYLLNRLRRAGRGTYPGPNLWQTLRRLSATFGVTTLLAWVVRQSFPSLISWHRHRRGARYALNSEFARAHRHRDDAAADAESDVGRRPSADRLRERLLRDHGADILPGLLHYGDAISMAHSIEARQPFLDYRLVEWLFARPSAIAIRASETKWLLRRYLREREQVRIAERRDKLGYPTPVERWLAAHSGAVARELLLSSGARIHAYVDPARVRRLIDAHAANRFGTGNHLYRLMSTELWLDTCIAGAR